MRQMTLPLRQTVNEMIVKKHHEIGSIKPGKCCEVVTVKWTDDIAIVICSHDIFLYNVST